MKIELKNKLLAVFTVIWLAISLCIYYLTLEDSVPWEGDTDFFKPPSFERIDKVVLKSVDDSVILRHEGLKWIVNEKYDADVHMVATLFSTINNAVPRNPVSPQHIDSIWHEIKTTGVVVQLYEADKKEIEFYVGGNKEKSRSYFGSDEQGIYHIAILGYRSYVSGIFELKELAWRTKRIFNFDWLYFDHLVATFPSNGLHNFVIAKEKRGFRVQGGEPTDTARMNTYLNDISLLSARRYITNNNYVYYDSLMQESPSIIIDVFDVRENTYTLRLYNFNRNDQYVIGITDSTYVALFATKDVATILKNRSYFAVP